MHKDCPHTQTTHLHTVVTHSTVGAARGSVEVAGGTPLHPKLDSPDLNVLIKGSTDVIVLIFILVSYERNSSDTVSFHKINIISLMHYY